VAIIGAFSAYLFNYFHWKTVKRNEHLSLMCSDLRVLISDLESISVMYWLRDYDELEKYENHISEINIKSYLKLIRENIRNLSNELNELNTFKLEQLNKGLNNFSSEIYDLITGDDFESLNRKAQKNKAHQISYRCSIIKSKISTISFI